MAVYKTKLIKKEEVAEGTMAFYFEKPDGFDFIAGQYVTVSLINPPETDNEGNSRFFSLITAPYENCLGVATRIRDTAFKRVLKNLPIVSERIANFGKRKQKFQTCRHNDRSDGKSESRPERREKIKTGLARRNRIYK